jgi:hypothetical protein
MDWTRKVRKGAPAARKRKMLIVRAEALGTSVSLILTVSTLKCLPALAELHWVNWNPSKRHLQLTYSTI